MKISDRDKKLILGVLLLAIILLPIFFFIRPKAESIKGLDAELVSLNERYYYLKDLQAKQPYYEEQIKLLSKQRDDMIAGYSQGLKPENTIMFLRNIELTFPIYMSAEAYSEYVYTPVSDGEVNVETGQVEGDLTAVRTTTGVTYSCSYDQLKHLLDYVYSNEDKMIISAITIQYNEDTDLVKGAFSIDEFAFIGSGRSVDSAKIPTLNRGKNRTPFNFIRVTWGDGDSNTAPTDNVEEVTEE